ncbi:MAG: efflux RND transporter periplasmic adaptor subunit [Verrucomicrobiales bacterium]|nr:efflux RND transporter periplasmic adaptor subunit [Verrucomicrobiales bacterium]
MKKIRTALQFLIAVLILGGAGVVAFLLLNSAPATVPEDRQQSVKIVQVVTLTPSDEKIHVSAWGTVIPAREVSMRPQVSGRVISQNDSLVPGGELKEGEELVRIDPADYELMLTEKTADLEDAKFEHEVELGRQIIAKREWEQLRKDLPEADMNPALALREPQLRKTEAMLTKAKNEIARAELDLARTRIVAPFNSMVTEESVEVGQLVESGGMICRLVGTDSFWVRATLPISELKRIRLPEGNRDGAAAEIHLDTGNGETTLWTGTAVRLLTDLDDTGRMARLLIEVEDPLGLREDATSDTPLLLGSYVRVDMEAGSLTDVLTIPRSALREGNRLWLVGTDNRIRIAEPDILWTRPNTVLVPNDLKPGERLIVSELKSALPGMVVNPQPLEGQEKTEKTR